MIAGYDQTRNDYNLPGLLPWQVYFLSFVLGIFSFNWLIPAAVALVVLWWADSRLRARPLLINALIAFMFLGYGYCALRMPDHPPAMPGWMEQREEVEVAATVDEVLFRPNASIRILLRDVRCVLPGQETVSLPGKVLWTWKYPAVTPEPGQSVQARLRVRPVRGFRNPGIWKYDWYWQRHGVYWQTWTFGRRVDAEWGEQPRELGWRIRSTIKQAVISATPKNQGAAMVLALLSGDRFWLSPKTLELVRQAGLAHTLALSGLHVGFVALAGVGLACAVGLLFPTVFLRIPRPKLMVVCALPFVLGYAWLGQPSPSLIRAALMFASWGVLLLLGRGRILMDGLLAAVAAIVLWNPLSVYDLSLQFSAVAVAGIALLFPLMQKVFPQGRTPGGRVCKWTLGILGLSVCANVVLMPLMTWYFGALAPNVIMNLVWLPLLGFVVIPLGFLGLFLSFVPGVGGAGQALLQVSAEVSDQMLSGLQWVSGVGWTPVFAVLRPLWPEMIGFALLLLAALVAISNRRIVWSVVGLGMVGLLVPHWVVLVMDSRDEIRMSVLDVGQGQAVLVTAPGGRRYLVDGGGTNSKTFDIGRAVVSGVLSYGRAPRLDGVFMSHPDTDHAQGLIYLLDKYRCPFFYTNGKMLAGRKGKQMQRALDGKGLAPQPLKQGDVVEAGPLVFEVLHPPVAFGSNDSNEDSLVLRLVLEGKGLALLPGDVGQQGIAEILRSGADMSAEVLLLPHHGSATGHDEELYDGIQPKLALASCGFLNRYGFPVQEIRRSMQQRSVPLLTTADQGMMTVRWSASIGSSRISFPADNPLFGSILF